MVSSSVSQSFPAKTGSRFATAALLAIVSWVAFAGCSKSECLRDDCLSSAPSDIPIEAGTAGNAGTAGAGNAGNAGAGSAPVSQPCTANSECQTDKGLFCVEGTCRLTCDTHFDCQGFGECTTGTDSDGASGHYCELGKTQQPGQFYTHCPAGPSDCDSAGGFFCISAGSEDLDAYCTTDCTDDSTCAAGYACTPLTRVPCDNTVCKNVTADPKDRTCIPDDQIGPGKPFQCSSRGATRNACRPRKFCSTCETDSDCLAASNQVCAKDQSGMKICTQPCDLKHPSCPWGNAGTCGIWDAERGVATCAHRFGKCVGSGKGCEPCLKDADCGAKGVCNSSSFTGERWCVDLSTACNCGAEAASTGTCTGGGCPKSPSGLQMFCVDSTTTTADDGVCVGANTSAGLLTSSSQQTGCWPQN